MTSLILHHYPQSPVAHKVRMALGIAGASWQSVEIPRLPPKPLLVPLTLVIGERQCCRLGLTFIVTARILHKPLINQLRRTVCFPIKLMAWP